jgi:histidyl-tRNA synthetase
MTSDRDAEILALIDRLTNEIKLARKHSLDHTIRLLQIAILDLRTVVFAISDSELRYVADALDDASLLEDKLMKQC